MQPKLLMRLENEFIILDFFPYTGRKIPEINQENFLEIIYKKYRIMYRIESVYKISILRIFHSSRNFQI